MQDDWKYDKWLYTFMYTVLQCSTWFYKAHYPLSSNCNFFSNAIVHRQWPMCDSHRFSPRKPCGLWLLFCLSLKWCLQSHVIIRIKALVMLHWIQVWHYLPEHFVVHIDLQGWRRGLEPKRGSIAPAFFAYNLKHIFLFTVHVDRVSN